MASKVQASSSPAAVVAPRGAVEMIEEELETTRRRLVKQVESRLARGTREVSKQSVTAAGEPTLELRVVRVLAEPREPKEIARDLGEPPSEVEVVLRRLAKVGKVSNVGSPRYPVWFARVGDQASRADVMRATTALIYRSPMTVQEVADATGVKPARISGTIAALRRGPNKERLVNRGFGRRDEWYLMPVGYVRALVDDEA